MNFDFLTFFGKKFKKKRGYPVKGSLKEEKIMSTG